MNNEEKENVGELPRSLSFLSILGLSFSILGVPFGLSTTLSIGLTDGGPVTIFYGWIFVSIVSICITGSLGEICSAYPRSGGVYYWSAMLSNEKWPRITSWITGWLVLIGNWTMITSICFSLGQLILSSIGLWNELYNPRNWHVLLTFWCVILICLLINIFGSKYLHLIDQICVYWTGGSVLIILITILTMAKDGRRSVKYVFREYDCSRSGWGMV